MSTPRGSRKIEAATRRLESARSQVLSAQAEREAWTAQCAGLKRSIDELQRTRDELKRTLVAAESNGEAAGKKLQTCEAEAEEAERALRETEGRYRDGDGGRDGSPGEAVDLARGAGDDAGGVPSPGPRRRLARPPQTPQPRQPSRKKNSSVHERISRARVFLENQRGELGASVSSATRPIPEDLSVVPASPGGTDAGETGYGRSPGQQSSASGNSASSRAVSPSPSRAGGGGAEADGPAVVVEGAGFGAANGTYRRSASHSSPTYSMSGTWLWRSGRYVLYRETNRSWKLGFWPEADMAAFPGSCSRQHWLYRGGPSGDGNGNAWEVVPSAGGGAPESRTSDRAPAPRVSVRGGEVSSLDDPSTTVQAASGGQDIRSESGVGANDRRVGRLPSPSSKRSSTPDGGAGTTRTRVQSHSFPPGPSQERASKPDGNAGRTKARSSPQGSSASTASSSPLTAALARRASLTAGTADSIMVSGAGTPEVNGVYTRHPDHLLDGCPVYGKTSYAGGGRHGAKRTIAICRVTANNGKFWFIKEKGSGHFYCAREKEADVPPRVGWKVSSSLSGSSPPPKLDW